MDLRTLLEVCLVGSVKAAQRAAARAAREADGCFCELGGFRYYPVSVLVRDPIANRKLHEYLLTGLKASNTPLISAEGEEYEVGVISLDPAPTIPPDPAVATPAVEPSTAGIGS